MGGYPPGTGPGDPNAPWNAPDPPSCPECDRVIGEPEHHDDDCPMGDADANDVAEYYRELQEPDYDELKDEQPPPDFQQERDTDMVIPERDDSDN